jgi:putative redox protein
MPTFQTIYQGDLRCQNTHLQSGTQIVTDAPTDNMGKGQAFSPTDLVATALGTCIITTMAIFGQKEGISFDGSSITGSKIMTNEGPRKIAEIQLELLLKTNIALEIVQKEKYERIAQTCPVARSLHPDIVQHVKISWQ